MIDVRGALPRATELGFSEIELWGYANGGVLRRDESTNCQWTGDDFDCAEVLTVDAPWHAIEYARHFRALTGRPSAPAPDVVSLSDLPHLPSRDVFVVDGIGPLRRLMRFPNDVTLFSAVEEDARLTATFYLVNSREVTKVIPRDLIEQESSARE